MIKAEKKGEKNIIITIINDYDNNIVLQTSYENLRKQINKAIESLYPIIK